MVLEDFELFVYIYHAENNNNICNFKTKNVAIQDFFYYVYCSNNGFFFIRILVIATHVLNSMDIGRSNKEHSKYLFKC